MIAKMHTATERSLAFAEGELISNKGGKFEDSLKEKIMRLKNELAQLEKMMGDEDE